MPKYFLLVFLCFFTIVAMPDNNLRDDLFALQKRLQEIEKQLPSKGAPVKKKTMLEDLKSLEKAVDEFYEHFSDDSFEALVEKVNTVPLENIGEITHKEELAAVKATLAEILNKMQKTFALIKKIGASSYLQQDFNEYVITSFMMQKNVADAFIEQKIKEINEKVTFEFSIENVKLQLEKFKNDPTPWNLSNLANALKFDFRSLDRVKELKKLGEIRKNFNRLADDIKNTFEKPNAKVQAFAKKMGTGIIQKQVKETIADPLANINDQFSEYMNRRLNAILKKK